jgi:hypothetical protein
VVDASVNHAKALKTLALTPFKPTLPIMAE